MSENAQPPIFDASDLTTKAWRLLEADSKELQLNIIVRPVLDFLSDIEEAPTSAADRRLILEQAMLIFDKIYPHMPFKTDLYHFTHPSDFLRQNVESQVDNLSELDFHSWMIAAFSLVRDAHTLYGTPFVDTVAFLPFQMRSYEETNGGRRYFVTEMKDSEEGKGFGHGLFAPGAEIVAWGSEPIENHVERAAGRLPGGNPSSAHTRAAYHCTVRPLAFCQPPFDEEMPAAAIYYRPKGETATNAISIPWGVATGMMAASVTRNAFSLSSLNVTSRACSQLLNRRSKMLIAKRTPEPGVPAEDSKLPDIFRFQHSGGSPRDGMIDPTLLADPAHPSARFGYVRIKSFDNGFGGDAMVDEFQRILAFLDDVAPDGLVVDVRSNPGGDVIAAERMLQMLTPKPILPARFHLANTGEVVAVLQQIAEHDRGFPEARAALRLWRGDAHGTPLPHGDRLTSGQPLTDEDSANDIGQVYQGSVCLLIDGLTYSAADMFSAGFQDNGIGAIYGVDQSTGGGGATVTSQKSLFEMFSPFPGVPIAKLPNRVTMTAALQRSSRVKHFEGQPVEDAGVTADFVLKIRSVDDLIHGHPGLIQAACEYLGRHGDGVPPARFTASNPRALENGAVAVDIKAAGIDLLRFFLDDHPASEERLEGDVAKAFTVTPADGQSGSSVLVIKGYRRAAGPQGSPPVLDLVAARRLRLVLKAPEAESAPDPDIDPITNLPKT